ncbi:MAG: 2-oxoglutarate dehydrogenase complex dihydrolipoyllysine-residue succinyltransferase [Pirellulaceae bacterium]
MPIELKIPAVGESVQEVQIGRWLKKAGDSVEEDQSVVELETDKASLEVPAPRSGVLEKILKQDGETVSVGEVIGYIQEGNGKPGDAKAEAKPKAETKPKSPPETKVKSQEESPVPPVTEPVAKDQSLPITPSARRALREHHLSPKDVEASGERLRREDVLRHVEHGEQAEPSDQSPTKEKSTTESKELVAAPSEEGPSEVPAEDVRRMSLIRRRIAQRLVEAQHTAALLTTFNEIDMSAVIALRKEHGERFTKRYGIKLGFMSFFVKAAIDALRQFPEINAEIRGEDQVVYHHVYHIGVAIGATKGLVVPVLKDAQWLSFAETEQAIADFARRAEENKLQPHELTGGTFTLTNGGVFGSLLSTPIVNPPQSGVLGMHSIQERPIGRAGQIVLAPMMYVALTYDHRLIDGRQAVLFLRRIKEAIEEPARMLVEV